MPVVLSGDENGVRFAAELIRSGDLVVVPTETVYGLAANALDEQAVSNIFELKGRPSTNPIIVHVCSIDQSTRLGHFQQRARMLAQHFWPGPLTIVTEAHQSIPKIVTAGGGTVGLRMPKHQLTLDVIRLSGLPIAAPSANRSENISPTTVGHVIRSFGESAPPILDGGPCAVGIESTVVDVTGRSPRILRPGAITRQQIEEVLGETVGFGEKGEIHRSPGQMVRHYAPQTPTALDKRPFKLQSTISRRGLLTYTSETEDETFFAEVVRLPDDPDGYAKDLYAALHLLDMAALDLITIEEPPDSDDWLAVRDRLRRASAPRLKLQ
jgi:L-threonylcarbamoyladenylate synthase